MVEEGSEMATLQWRRRGSAHGAPAERRIILHAPLPVVEARLTSYEAVCRSPKPSVLQLAETAGWTVVRPPSSLHPALFHNLALWLLETPDCPPSELVALVAESGDRPGYWLRADPSEDCLSGRQTDGVSITVAVMENSIARGGPIPPAPQSAERLLQLLGAPRGIADVASVGHPVRASQIEVTFENPFDGLNELNLTTHGSRAELLRSIPQL